MFQACSMSLRQVMRFRKVPCMRLTSQGGTLWPWGAVHSMIAKNWLTVCAPPFYNVFKGFMWFLGFFK